MKKLVLASIIFFELNTILFAQWINGYTKTNGQYVQGYNRSSKNSSTYDNYSTKGNYNPYTGKKGTKNPYKSYNYSNSYGKPSKKSNSYYGY